MIVPLDIENPLIREINASRWLMTKVIELTSHRLLRVSVGIGSVGEETDPSFQIPDVKPLTINDDFQRYTFSFLEFVSYSVTEEMFRQRNVAEASQGGWVRVYSSSFFLDYIRNSTWANSLYPIELVHYQINTLDHTIDIITPNAPELTAT